MIYFIPARKGSQRVANKNLRYLGGKPLIEWTFDLLKPGIDTVIVSSDDQEILDSAKSRGFIAICRNDLYCTANAKMSDVLKWHSSDFKFNGYYGSHKKMSEQVCVLYPTSPFRTRQQIDSAILKWYKNGDASTVLMSVTQVTHKPLGLLSIDRGNLVFNDEDGAKYYRAQDMPANYRANGSVYVIPLELICDDKIDAQLFGPRNIPYVMDKLSSFEIDEEEDIYIANSILSYRTMFGESNVSLTNDTVNAPN